MSASRGGGHLFCWTPGGKHPFSTPQEGSRLRSLSQATRRQGNQPCVFERSFGLWVPVSVTQLVHVISIPAETLEPDPKDRSPGNRIYGRGGIGGWGVGRCVRALKRRPQLGVAGWRPACPLPCDLSLRALLFRGLRRTRQHPSEGQRPVASGAGRPLPLPWTPPEGAGPST